MNLLNTRRRFAISVAAVLPVVSLSNPATAADAPPTTRPAAPKVVSADLSLSQKILEAHEKTVGVTSIRGLEMTVHSMHLVGQKPVEIVKEPAYVAKPMYGAIRIGDGPKSVTYFAVDEGAGPDGKIYVDRNQNGDLTDDGDTDWTDTFVRKSGRNFEKSMTVHASWGNAIEEKESGDYTIWISKVQGGMSFGYFGMTGRIGSLALNGKAYPVVMGDGSADGIYTVAAEGDITRPPVKLYVDIDSAVPADAPAPKVDPTSLHRFTAFNLAFPFQIDGHWYAARPTVSGGTLKVVETTAPGVAAAAAEPPVKNITVGQQAPDFTIQKPDGTPLKLSDYKGKIVILDFWATWCGPCQAAMPALEKLYQGVKDQNVVVMSVNVFDAKVPFDAWIKEHAGTEYHFDFGFDPAGKGDDGVAKSLYNVFGIPAVFVIGPDGKVAANVLGGDEYVITKALAGLGVKVK